jgi:hypothetical protein
MAYVYYISTSIGRRLPLDQATVGPSKQVGGEGGEKGPSLLLNRFVPVRRVEHHCLLKM